MIIGCRFPGDTWHRVMGIQHDAYSSQVAAIFEAARTVYLRAEAILGVSTVPGILVATETRLDHRVLQELHDLIAASFRYTHQQEFHPQLPFNGPEDDDKRIERLWRAYFSAEVQRLASQAPIFVKAVVNAVAFENTDVGYAAEEVARECLLNQYPILDSTTIRQRITGGGKGIAYPVKGE